MRAPVGIGGAVVEVDRNPLRADEGIFCGECSNLIQRGPFTIVSAELPESETRWLCVPCTETAGLVVGHNYASGECPCNGDARAHGYLRANGD